MKRIVFATIPLAMFAGIGAAHVGIPQAMAGPVMSQDQFPCQEDEVLGYAPEFGHDHVGCIHIDQLRGE